MADLQKTIEIIFGAEDQTGDAFSSVGESLKTVNQAIGDVAEPLANLSDKVLLAEAALASLGAAFLGVASNESDKFTDKIEEIGSLVNATPTDVQKLSQAVQDFAINSTSDFGQIQKAVYDTTSALGSTEKALAVLAVAESGAIVGATDLSNASNALTNVLNAYGLASGSSAEITANSERVMAALFATVQSGKTTMPELADNIGKVSSTAAAANIPIEVIGAAIAALTGAGINTEQSMTLLNAAIKELLNPSDKLKESLGGISLTSDGLEAVLSQLQTVTGGNSQKFFELFGSAEAAKGALILTNDSAGKFKSTLAAMPNALEAFNSNLDQMSGGVHDAEQKLENAFIVLMQKIGDRIVSQSEGIATIFKNLFVTLGKSVDDGDFNPVFEAINRFGGKVTDTLRGIAESLPEALKLVDFEGLIDSFERLGVSVDGLFDNIDLKTPEGLASAIQLVVNTITSFTNVASGIIEAWKPVIDFGLKLLDLFNKLDPDTQVLIGSILGVSKIFQTFSPLVTTAFNAIVTLSGSISTLIPLLGGGALAGALTGTGAALLTATGAVSYFGTSLTLTPAIDKVISDLRGFDTTLGSTIYDIVHFGDTQITASTATEQLSKEIISANQALAKASQTLNGYKINADGTIESTAKTTEQLNAMWESAGKTASKFIETAQSGVVLQEGLNNLNGDIGLTSDEFDDLIKRQEAFSKVAGKNTDATDQLSERFQSLTKDFTLTADELKRLNAAGESAVDAYFDQNGALVIVSDNTKTFAEVTEDSAEAQKKANDAIKAASDPLKDLSDKEKLVIENTQKTHELMLKLASDERIKSMEFQVNIDVARLEAQVKQVEAAFNAIGSFYQENANIIGTLTEGYLAGATDKDREFFREMIEKQLDMEQQVVDSQTMLNESISELNRAYAQSLTQETLVRIDSNGLDPALEAFMFEVLKKIQTSVVGDRAAFLLGAGQIAG